MNFDRKDVEFLVVNINDTRHIPHVRRNGPMSNLAVPLVHFTFLESQSYSMEVLKAVMKNGDVLVNPIFAAGVKPLAPAVVREVIQAAAEVVVETPAPAPAVEQPVAQEPAQEPAQEQAAEDKDGDGHAGEEDRPLDDANGDGKINLMDTITETDGEIALNVLTLAQYESYTKAELFEFLSKIADQFPADVKKQIKKSATEKQLLEIIAANLI
jgi:ribosomal protein L12E/L44/L45/RPP1/RPP2